jgi:hypothetical protein
MHGVAHSLRISGRCRGPRVAPSAVTMSRIRENSAVPGLQQPANRTTSADQRATPDQADLRQAFSWPGSTAGRTAGSPPVAELLRK